jgi:TorA maturation chaperone TorD
MTLCTNIAAFDAAANMARQTLYRFAALSLLDPKAGSWERLDALREDQLLIEAAALIRDQPEAIPKQLGPGERPHGDLDPRRVLDRLPRSAAALNAEYEKVFGLLVSAACPPYETEYINGKFTFQRSNTLADVNGFYLAFGLTTTDEHWERADHIVQELEFMAFLLSQERRAANGGSALRQQNLEVCREAQARFLGEHLAWWAPAFAKLLSRENQDGFYGAVGVFLAALVPAERALAGVEAAGRFATPSSLERPEECDGCQLASS